jgi:outer membrane protein assembly factor BamB
MFTADQAGRVTAIDLESPTGAEAWRADTGERFTAGVSGINQPNASPTFRAAYDMDLLVLGSARPPGEVLAIDARHGTIVWDGVDPKAPVTALITYDSATNRIFVPTAGRGVVAYSLNDTKPGDGPKTEAWRSKDAVYTHHCTKGYDGRSIVCVDTSGVLKVLDKATGTELGLYETGLPNPTSVVALGAPTPGFVVANASRVLRLLASGTAPLTITPAGPAWMPGGTLSPVFVFPLSGYLVVAANDRRLHKLSLDTLQPLGTSVQAETASGSSILGPIGWSQSDQLYVFGTDEGRVWAIPSF